MTLEDLLRDDGSASGKFNSIWIGYRQPIGWPNECRLLDLGELVRADFSAIVARWRQRSEQDAQRDNDRDGG